MVFLWNSLNDSLFLILIFLRSKIGLLSSRALALTHEMRKQEILRLTKAVKDEKKKSKGKIVAVNSDWELKLRAMEKDHAASIEELEDEISRLKFEKSEVIRENKNATEKMRAENEALKLAQANTLPLPDPPSILPGDALKRWGDKLDSKKE